MGNRATGCFGYNRSARLSPSEECMNLALVRACFRFATVFLLSGCFAVPLLRAECPELGTQSEYLGISTVRLWTGDAPQARGNSCDDIPFMTVFKPQYTRKNGNAVLILPGGAYLHLASILEGREVADWFTARGFTAFVLHYRMGKNYLLPVPLLDARRAIQMVRADASTYQIDPDRIAVIGFSAGGHLAALSATQFVAGDNASADPIARVSSRPDALILGYGWLGGVTPDTSHLSYCKLMDVMDRCAELQKQYTPERFVTAQTPPTFLYHTTEDTTVPVQQALGFYQALLDAHVSAEMHIFAHGGHGSGLGKGNAALDQWTVLLETWLRGMGWLPR